MISRSHEMMIGFTQTNSMTIRACRNRENDDLDNLIHPLFNNAWDVLLGEFYARRKENK